MVFITSETITNFINLGDKLKFSIQFYIECKNQHLLFYGSKDTAQITLDKLIAILLSYQYVSSLIALKNKDSLKIQMEEIINKNKLLVMLKNVISILFFVNDKSKSVCIYSNIFDYTQRVLYDFDPSFAFTLHIIF